MSIDKIEIFLGRLGRKPDLRYTSKREAVCYLSVAVNSFNENLSTWKRVVVWGKQAELCSLYLKKGSEVFVQGLNSIRQFEDQSGNRKSFEEIKAKVVGFTNV